MRRSISRRFFAKALFGSENPFRGIPVQLSICGVILFKITRSLNRARSSVVWIIPFLILLKSSFRLGLFLVLSPSCFLALRLLELCPVSGFTNTSAMDSASKWTGVRDRVSIICNIRTNQVKVRSYPFRVLHVIRGSGHVLRRYDTWTWYDTAVIWLVRVIVKVLIRSRSGIGLRV